MNSQYEWLFPFEQIKKDSDILIYGAGFLGQEYVRQIKMTNYCNIIAIIDKRWDVFLNSEVPIISINSMNDYRYDYIIIALQNSETVKEVYKNLLNYNVEENKIICGVKRNPIIFSFELFEKRNGIIELENKMAFHLSGVSIAMHLPFGLGDTIIRKKIFEEIARIAPSSHIDIYSKRPEEDIIALFGFERNFNNAFRNYYNLYHKWASRYMCAITVGLSATVDYLDESRLKCKDAVFFYKMKRLLDINMKEEADTEINWGAHYKRCYYKGLNAYTAFNRSDIFTINDNSVRMLLNKEWNKAFNDLGIDCYITINYGNVLSDCPDLSAKQWPYEYFATFVECFKLKFKNVKIVQLGANNSKKVPCVDKYIFGENLELVKYILAHAIFHLDIDGGLVHLATQLHTKCIVLYGQSVLEYYGYTQNINIAVGNCRGCAGLYKETFVCAKGMDKPECMYLITPDLVMEKVCEYLSNLS